MTYCTVFDTHRKNGCLTFLTSITNDVVGVFCATCMAALYVCTGPWKALKLMTGQVLDIEEGQKHIHFMSQWLRNKRSELQYVGVIVSGQARIALVAFRFSRETEISKI